MRARHAHDIELHGIGMAGVKPNLSPATQNCVSSYTTSVEMWHQPYVGEGKQVDTLLVLPQQHFKPAYMLLLMFVL